MLPYDFQNDYPIFSQREYDTTFTSYTMIEIITLTKVCEFIRKNKYYRCGYGIM